jgi:AI-2 transport protein TqsA
MIEDFKTPSFLQVLLFTIILISLMGLNYLFPGLNYLFPVWGPLIISIFIGILIYPFLMWLNKKNNQRIN